MYCFVLNVNENLQDTAFPNKLSLIELPAFIFLKFVQLMLGVQSSYDPYSEWPQI